MNGATNFASPSMQAGRAAWSPICAQAWLISGLIVFFAIIHLQYTLKLARAESTRSAFLRWRTQLHDLDRGINVWDKYAYPNPPIMALILKPFFALPPTLGASLWFALKSALAIASILMLFARLDAAPIAMPRWGKFLAIALTLRPMEGDLVHGNVNLFILFLIVAALVAYQRRQDGVAGLLLGLSIACKLTPALFIPYFVWKRAWRTLLGIVSGLILFVLIVPATFFGWNENVQYLKSWHHQMVAPFAAGIVTSEHKNQSLPGLMHRLLTDAPSFSDYDGDRKVVLETHNVLALSSSQIQILLAGCMGIFVCLVIRFVASGDDRRLPLVVCAEFGVIVLGMLLFSERTWKHHCVTLLVPFAVLAYSMATPGRSRVMRWGIAIALVLAALLMLSTSTGVFDRHVEAEDRVGKIAQVYGAYLWAFLILLAGMLAILRQSAPGDCACVSTRSSGLE